MKKKKILSRMFALLIAVSVIGVQTGTIYAGESNSQPKPLSYNRPFPIRPDNPNSPFRHRIMNIREMGYRDGYRDGRAHRPPHIYRRFRYHFEREEYVRAYRRGYEDGRRHRYWR